MGVTTVGNDEKLQAFVSEKTMKILILADQCNPEWPSLPVVGYKSALAISEIVNCVVVTHIRNKPNIEKIGFGRAEVVYVDTEYLAKPLHNFAKWIRGSEGGWTTAMALAYPSYLAFEWEAYKFMKKRIKQGEFDLIHRVTPMSPTLPSFLAVKTHLPFILGPLNGGLKWPSKFTKERKKEREWLSLIRSVYKYLPYHKSSQKRAKVILAGFQHTIDDIPKKLRNKVINFPEVGVDPSVFNNLLPRVVREKKTILFASRLVPYKLPDIVVDAFVESEILQQHELLIVGDGPLRTDMEAKVIHNGLQHVIKFLGWKSQNEVSQFMQRSEIFAYPTIRELGAGALVEAMACKMACVVVDYGAPSTLIDDERGIKIDINEKSKIKEELTLQLEKLVLDSDRIANMGEQAYEHVMKFYTWQAKAKKTVEVYRWALDLKDNKPDFWG